MNSVEFVPQVFTAANPAWWVSTLEAQEAAVRRAVASHEVEGVKDGLGGVLVRVNGWWYFRPEVKAKRGTGAGARKSKGKLTLPTGTGVKVAKGATITFQPSAAWAGAGPGPAWAPERPAADRSRVLCGPDGVSVSVALKACAVPAGPLLGEAAGQVDLSLARAVAGGVIARMRAAGKSPSDTTADEAAAAAAYDLQLWRAGLLDGASAPEVARRAVNASIEADGLGESQSVGGPADLDGLWGGALPLPGVDDSRADRLSRLLADRARAKRPVLLGRRFEWLRSLGGRGRRAAALDRIEVACRALLSGVGLDEAAERAGFVRSGRTSAGDRLARAVRALGFQVQLTARDGLASVPVVSVSRLSGEVLDVGARTGARTVPMTAETLGALSVDRCADLPAVQPSKARGPAVRRLARLAKRAERARTAAVRARAEAERADAVRASAVRAERSGRSARRLAKHAGAWAERSGDGVGAWAVRAPWSAVVDRA